MHAALCMYVCATVRITKGDRDISCFVAWKVTWLLTLGNRLNVGVCVCVCVKLAAVCGRLHVCVCVSL